MSIEQSSSPPSPTQASTPSTPDGDEAAVITRFVAELARHGLITDDTIVADGELHRFHVEDDKPGSRNGWYVLHHGEVVAASFGCWKRGLNKHWFGSPLTPLSFEELEKAQAVLKSHNVRREQGRLQREAECAIKAKRIWEQATSANEHPYLATKRVACHGLKQSMGSLVVPLHTPEMSIVSLQFIHADGSKYFMTGTPKKGNFFLISTPDQTLKTILVCEGYATGATLFECTGHPVAVAFDAGNLMPVAEALRVKFPNSDLLMCADNDHTGEINTGLVKAKQAAKKVGGKVAAPSFQPGERGTDFNDLFVVRGEAAVQTLIKHALDMPREQSGITQEISGKSIRLDESGVFFFHEQSETWNQISSPIRILAKTRDYTSKNWGRLLEWIDNDGITHRWAMPMEMLQGDGTELRKTLASRGALLVPSKQARDQLVHYLGGWQTSAKARCVSRLGWEGEVYVLPDRCIGESNEIIVYQNHQAIEPGTSCAGTLDEWNERIGKMTAGNSRLVFAVAAALAAPLAALAEEDSGGFNFRGQSSCGKSTALKVAASVWGRPDRYCRNWRATANGLEGLAAMHNDALLILDEISQIDAADAGDAAYMLANGQGKARAGRSGETRQSASWRLLFLSAGEVSLATLMESVGKQANAGQEIRLADIPADAGAGMGLFENIHDASSSAVFAESLAESTTKFHGELGIAWLSHLVEHRANLIHLIRPMLQKMVTHMLEPESAGQIARVARRFALVGVAGEIATAAKLVEWQKGQSSTAAIACFSAWREAFGDTGNREDRALIDRLRAFMSMHASSRFERFGYDATDARTLNRAGFVRTENGMNRYWMLPDTFRSEICKGVERSHAEKLLIEEGYIQAGGDGRATINREFGDHSKMRVYVLTQKVFE